MAGHQPLQLTLSVDTAASPIEGTVVDASERAHSFAGWMELVARIDEAIAADGGATDEDLEDQA